MYQQEEPERIASVQVDSLIWSDSGEVSQSQEIPSFQIYTVSKNLKNPKILEHIKPDYGSLGQFMKNVAISKDILMHNRKKKNEQQQDLEQKKIRSMLKNQNLEKVLKQQSSTALEKSIASKMIVENIFENKFGTGLQIFCAQNSKLQNLSHNHSSVSQLANLLDNMMLESKSDSKANYDMRHQLPILSRKHHMLSSKEVKPISLSEKLEKLKRLQQNYPNFRKISLPAPEASDSSFSPLQKGVLSFSKCSLSLQSLANTILLVQFQSIRSLRLSNVIITEDLLSLLLDYFTDHHCTELKELIVEHCSFPNSEKVALRLKTFIQESEIARVELIGIGLSNRDFCFLCLGIGARKYFEYLGLKDNKIGEVAKKCLDVLLKFHKETRFNFAGNPIQRQIKGRPGYSRCFT